MKLVGPNKPGRITFFGGVTRAMLNKINDLIKNIQHHPFQGLGKPEALRFALSAWWSRRIPENTVWYTG
ncbi:MAG TPA: type II toxin-antitoxin system YoeB family toxin [Steroidobacteraceae bacterium]|jgi:Txe/YoeB family toxin of toxin-antitoxin system|nr:type II toxin-antitoxin system YoeB family toxin [Steroidobacteraceae bacterium]